MLFKVYEKGNYQVVKFNEVLTLTSKIMEIESVVSELLEKNFINIAMSFQNNSYFTSSTGAIIIRCMEGIKEKHGTLTLVNINKDIRDFLEIIDMESRVVIIDNEDDLV